MINPSLRSGLSKLQTSSDFDLRLHIPGIHLNAMIHFSYIIARVLLVSLKYAILISLHCIYHIIPLKYKSIIFTADRESKHSAVNYQQRDHYGRGLPQTLFSQ